MFRCRELPPMLPSRNSERKLDPICSFMANINIKVKHLSACFISADISRCDQLNVCQLLQRPSIATTRFVVFVDAGEGGGGRATDE